MLPYELGHLYHAFVDMSGGKDDAVLCIGHEENGRVIPDRIEQQAGDAKPFNPRQAAVKFAALLREYRLSSVMGDAYAGNTFKADFEFMGISYTICPWTKSDLYSALEPAINAGEVELPDIPKLIEQLLCLVTRGAKIDHEPNGHDDWANAVAGLVWKIRRATLTDAVICAPFIAEGVPRNVPGGVIGVGYLPTPVLAAPAAPAPQPAAASTEAQQPAAEVELPAARYARINGGHATPAMQRPPENPAWRGFVDQAGDIRANGNSLKVGAAWSPPRGWQ